MKILLINPPFQRLKGFRDTYFPLGLGYVGAALSERGFEAKIYNAENPTKDEKVLPLTHLALLKRHHLYTDALTDCKHPVWEEISRVLNHYRPDVVGITVATPVYGSAVRVTSLCKEYDKNCLVIWGGPHGTLQSRQILQTEKNVDFVAIGEGERTIAEFIETLQSGGCNFGSVNGLAFRANGDIQLSAPRTVEKNLDNFPFPSRALLLNPDNKYPVDVREIIASRGCAYSCAYCSSHHIWGHKCRRRSVQNIIDEIKMRKEEYNIKEFRFQDDTFTLNKKWVEELCQAMIKEKLYISWWCNTRADNLDEELLHLMKRAGCYSMHIGVETGDEEMMRSLNRRLTLDDIWRASRYLTRSGIDWYAYFMVGFPNETKESIEKTRKLMRELPASRITFGVFTPYPGTLLYDKAKEMGLISEPIHWSKFSHQSAENYFIRDISRKEFSLIVADMAEEVDKLNASLSARLRRIIAMRRYYYRNPSELLGKLIRSLLHQ